MVSEECYIIRKLFCLTCIFYASLLNLFSFVSEMTNRLTSEWRLLLECESRTSYLFLIRQRDLFILLSSVSSLYSSAYKYAYGRQSHCVSYDKNQENNVTNKLLIVEPSRCPTRDLDYVI